MKQVTRGETPGCCRRGHRSRLPARLLAMAIGLCLGVVGAPRLAGADDVAKAREHFKRGSTHYYLQRYLEAAAEYEKSYEYRDEPSLLFNIGQAYRLGGEAQKAIFAYRSYLSRVPNAPNRAEVLGLIDDAKKTLEAQARTRERPPTGTLGGAAELGPGPKASSSVETAPAQHAAQQAQLAAQQAQLEARQAQLGAQQAQAAQTAPAGPSPRALERAGLAVGGVGVASLAAGAALGGLFLSQRGELYSTDHPRYYDDALYRQATTFGKVAPVLLGVGAAALVTGGALFAVGHRRARAASSLRASSSLPAASWLRAGVTAGGVLLGGSF